MKRQNLKFILIQGLISVSTVFAGTDLPYLGPETIACEVNVALSEAYRNAGYLTNEDCSIIFVKPPVHGALWLSEGSGTWDLGLCEPINLVIEALTNKIRQSQVSTSTEDLLKVTSEIYQLKKTLDRFDDSAKPVFYISAQFSTDWASMLTSFRNSNPNKIVKPLPISLGLLTLAAYDEEESELSDITTGQLPLVKINALQMPENMTLQNPLFPQWINKLTSNSFVMGQSASATLGLSLKHACPVYQPNGGGYRKSTHQAAEAYLGATYTYFYPVQSKAFFKVELDKSAVLSAISKTILEKKSNDLTVPDLYQATKDTGAFSIIFNPGLTQQQREALVAYEKELKAMAINSFLMSATSNLKRAVESHTTSNFYTTWIKECERFLFWKDCRVHSYTIKVESIDWSQVDKSMESLAMLKSSASTENYETLIMYDSTTFRLESK